MSPAGKTGAHDFSLGVSENTNGSGIKGTYKIYN